jgi:hypothetical protein
MLDSLLLVRSVATLAGGVVIFFITIDESFP